MLRYLTAGESHGRCLVAILEGMVSGLKINLSEIDKDLARRQSGYGRGKRMDIEYDKVRIVSGLRRGKTIGSPIALIIENRDYSIETLPEISQPRPGHADLAGALKYNQDIRDVLERASARETAIRVAIGGICKIFLKEFGVKILAHVVNIGGIEADCRALSYEQLEEKVAKSDLGCADSEAEKRMKDKIDKAGKEKNSLGGIFEVIARGVPVGLGTYVQPDRRLDSRLAAALMSIPAIKAVEIGLGFGLASRLGSEVHDEIFSASSDKERNPTPYFVDNSFRFLRRTNNAGGLEGGVTNGQPVILRCCMKPIPTLGQPLASVDLKTGQEVRAAIERADICAVPAAAVVGEAMVAYELARAFIEKFGGDSIRETKENCQNYIKNYTS